MNKRITAHRIMILLLLLAPFLAGCMGEKDRDCSIYGKQPLTIRFLHNINPEHNNTLSSVINFIDLYFYTETGQIFETVHLTKEELEKTNYTYTGYFKPGTYRLSSWMNTGDNEYNVNYHERINTGHVEVIGQQYHLNVAENTSAVFYGYDDRLYDIDYENQDVVFTIEGYPIEKTINFAKNTNHIEVVTKFDRVLVDPKMIDIRIVSPNGLANFVNRAVPNCARYTYHPYQDPIVTTYELDPIYGYKYYYSQTNNFTTQRLWEGDEAELIISYTDYTGYVDVIARYKLTDDLIMKNPLYNNNFQLERYDQYQIVFYFDFDRQFIVTEIIVNDWVLINQPHEL